MRPIRLLVALAMGAAVITVTPAAAPASSPVQQRIATGRVALGDSVMEGAKSQLRRRGYSVDTAMSRQVSEGLAALRTKKKNGTLRRQVVVHLGTNGTFTASQCRSMHRLVGNQRNLLLLTVKVPRSWEAPNNRVIRTCAKKYPNTYLLDWNRYVRRHNGIVEGDGYHLTPKGARRYARLVDHRVDQLHGR